MRTALALSIPLLFLASACTYDNGDSHHFIDQTPDPQLQCGSTIARSTIDVGSQIDIDAGAGAGVFIEYATGGHWHVRTSCDTSEGSPPCTWDILVSPEDGQTLSNVTPEDLEADDSLHPYSQSDGTYQLNATTSADLDGFTFDTAPGASVQVDALLDDVCAVPYFFWVGDGALHSGSPSNPLVLSPSSN